MGRQIVLKTLYGENAELERSGKKVVMVSLKVTYRHLAGGMY
jgi:hypothetical protein